MDIVVFLSENVGTAGISFGIGCVVTYGFCMRTFIKTASESRRELKEENRELKIQIKELQDKYENFILNR